MTRKILPIKWAKVARDSAGQQTAEWNLRLANPLVEEIPRLDEAARESSNYALGFVVVLAWDGAESLTAKIVTRHGAMDAMYYPLTYRMFRIIESNVGVIDTVQSLPKKWYAPFRESGASGQ